MSDEDSFEARLRAIADQIVDSLSNNDLDDVAQRFGVEAERARELAGNVERWVIDRLSELAPRGGDRPGFDDSPWHTPPAASAFGSGPHPLDVPTREQGIALSALDSGRFTVTPGSSVLTATGSDSGNTVGGGADLVNELRARDWIKPDGTVTLVGREALLRWCRAADGSAEPPQPDDV